MARPESRGRCSSSRRGAGRRVSAKRPNRPSLMSGARSSRRRATGRITARGRERIVRIAVHGRLVPRRARNRFGAHRQPAIHGRPRDSRGDRIALSKTVESNFGKNHCLCHGDLGHLDILLHAAQRVDDSWWREEGKRLASETLDGIAERGCLSAARKPPWRRRG